MKLLYNFNSFRSLGLKKKNLAQKYHFVILDLKNLMKFN